MNIILCVILVFLPFGDVFTTENTFIIPEANRVSSQNYTTYRQYCTVSPSGNKVVFIDYREKEVVAYDLTTGITKITAPHTNDSRRQWGPVKRSADTIYFSRDIETVAEEGRKPDEVSIPVAVEFDRTGDLFVSDAGNRRVSIFDSDLNFKSSFILPTDVGTPSNMMALNGDHYLCANLKIDSARTINAGHWCNIFTRNGKLINSFAYTPDEAFDRNLWLGVYSLIDIDENGNIYVIFTIEPKIYVYEGSGKLLNTFKLERNWWVPPPKLEQSPFHIRKEPKNFHGHWTRIIKLIYVGKGKLLVVYEANNLVENCNKRFMIDIYSISGELIQGNVCSDYLPVGVDNGGKMYFLSVDGSQLIRTKPIE